MLIPPTLIGLIQECRYVIPKLTGPDCCPPDKVYIDGCGCLDRCPAGTYRNPDGCDCLPVPPVIQPEQFNPLPTSGPLPTEGPARWSSDKRWRMVIRGQVGFNCDVDGTGRPYCLFLDNLLPEDVTTMYQFSREYVVQRDGRFNNYCGPELLITWFYWGMGGNPVTPRTQFWLNYFNNNVPPNGNYYGRRDPTELNGFPIGYGSGGFTGIQPCADFGPVEEWKLYRIKIKLEPRPLPIWFETALPEPTRTIYMRLPSPAIEIQQDGLYLTLSNGDTVGPLGYTLSERVFYKYELEEVEEVN